MLSAVLVVVALNMGEWKNFTHLPSWLDKDAQLFLVAFTLTLLQASAMPCLSICPPTIERSNLSNKSPLTMSLPNAPPSKA
jgi:hypothetical protein